MWSQQANAGSPPGTFVSANSFNTNSFASPPGSVERGGKGSKRGQKENAEMMLRSIVEGADDGKIIIKENVEGMLRSIVEGADERNKL
jgi:hypothetical protein